MSSEDRFKDETANRKKLSALKASCKHELISLVGSSSRPWKCSTCGILLRNEEVRNEQ